MVHNPIRAAVFASGNGTNAENIIRFAKKHPDHLSIPLVITNKPEAGVIARAYNHSIPYMIIPHSPTQDAEMLQALSSYGIQWIFLAGYMRILSANFLQKFTKMAGESRIINIHPSLLPAFPGKDAYRQAFEAGVKISGATLHYVDEGVDTGPVILQQEFSRLENDTLESFQRRGMEIEYALYTAFLEQLCFKKEVKWATR